MHMQVGYGFNLYFSFIENHYRIIVQGSKVLTWMTALRGVQFSALSSLLYAFLSSFSVLRLTFKGVSVTTCGSSSCSIILDFIGPKVILLHHIMIYKYSQITNRMKICI